MDQANFLRSEARSAHSAFHEFVLLQNKSSTATHFLFFEGKDDPSFYMGKILPFLGNCEYHEFVCDGRDGVLKAYDLCARDARAIDRSLYFVDKDHSDILEPEVILPTRIYQTEYYSFENYIVCQAVFRRYWVERLHLSISDTRYVHELSRFEKLHSEFLGRMKLLSAIMILSRGYQGHEAVKLNLNNVRLEKVIKIDFEDSPGIAWQPSGGKTFLAATNASTGGIEFRSDEIRHVCRTELIKRSPKEYVRGKFELWFLVTVLSLLARKLGNKETNIKSALPRASTKELANSTNSIAALSSLVQCPESLRQYLKKHTSLN